MLNCRSAPLQANYTKRTMTPEWPSTAVLRPGSGQGKDATSLDHLKRPSSAPAPAGVQRTQRNQVGRGDVEFAAKVAKQGRGHGATTLVHSKTASGFT